MATMYVDNIPTNETVNLRKTPSSSGTILVRVGYGKAVEASYYNATWHSASYNGYSGYIMSQFLSSTDPNGSSSGNGTPTVGVIQGTNVRVRSQPNTTSTILAHVNTGDQVTYYAGETYNGSGYTWYRCTGSKWSGNGYIATNYVSTDNGGSAPTSGYAKIKSTVSGIVNIRETASTSSRRLGKWKANSMFYITGTSGDWRKIRFGKPHTPQAVGGEAWIHGDYIESASAGSTFAERYCNIAKSFAGQTGADAFEYTSSYGEWCQAFLLNMAIMAGLPNPSSNLPCNTSNGDNTSTWSAYQWMMSNGTVTTNLSSCTIKKGDWLYYKRGSDNMSHVGLIVDVNGRQVKRVEGNIANDSGAPIVKYFSEWITLDQISDAYAIARNW